MIGRWVSQAGALLLKEIQHHWIAMIGVCVLYIAMSIVVLATQLNQQAGSLIETAANLGWFAAPMVSAFLVSRLIVLEYKQGTYEFLTGLPSSAFGRALIKGAFGLVIVEIIAVLTTLVIALLASLQEITGAAFVLQAIVQIAVYVWAWYAIVFIAAHLGRFRAVFWLLFFPALLSTYTIDERLLEEVLWTASLANPLDQARVYVPWAAIGLTTAWAIGLSLVGLLLAGLRGGALVAAWFRPAAARERAAMAVIVILGIFAISWAEEVNWLGGPVYGSVPQVREGGKVRVIGPRDGALFGHGERIQATLDRMAPYLSDELPELVLVPAHGSPEHVVSLRSSEFRELVLVVDVQASPARIEEECIGLLLDWWNGTQLRRRGGLAWIVLGAPRWWSADDEARHAYELRAAWAGARLDSPAELEDLRELEARMGTDVTRSVAHVGLRTLAEQTDDAAVDALLTEWLGHEGTDGLVHTLRMDALPPDTWLRWSTGVDGEAHRDAWFNALKELSAEHEDELAPWIGIEGELRVVPGDEAEVVIESSLSTPLASGAAVAWTVLPPLHRRPLPRASWDRRTLHAPVERVPTSAPGHRDVVARYELYVPAFDGDISFGLVAP